MGVFGVMEFEDIFKGFGDNTVMMAFGVIAIGNTLFETGCAGLIGRKIAGVKWLGNSERVFLLALMIVTATISAFVSNTATVAMMLPLIAAVASESKGKISKKNSCIAIGIASVLGGNVTLAGSTPQIVAQGILQKTAGARTLTFFELSKSALPVIITMLLYFSTIGYRLQKRVFNFPEVPDAKKEGVIQTEVNMRKIWTSAAIFLGCILGFTSGYANFGAIAVSGACLCVITGCITPKRLWETMDWRTIAVLGGSLGFATGVSSSGATEMISERLLAFVGGENIFLIGVLILVICALASNFMSNTAITAIMTPFAISLALRIGIDPIPLVVMTIIGSSLAFATPVSTPPMTMTLIAGYRFMDYVKVGGLLNLLVVVMAAITIPFIYGII